MHDRPRRLTINRNRPRYHGLDMKRIVASMPITLNFGGKMAGQRIKDIAAESMGAWMELMEDRADGLEGSSNELRYREMEILERIEALETEGMFGKGMLARLTKLEDWKQDCESSGITPDPFGKYADGYPPAGHPDRRDTQTPDIDSVDVRKDDFQPKASQNNCDNCLYAETSTTDEPYTHDDRIDWDDPAEWPIPATLDDLAQMWTGAE